MQNNCIKCNRALCGDDIGATKKLINRGSTEFMCISCLAKKYGVTEERIKEKIEEWRASGCALFAAERD